MKQGPFIRNLTVVTVMVLTGIVALQIYWLTASFRQQQSRFKADIENALAAANVKISLRKALKTDKSGLMGALDLNMDSTENLLKEYRDGGQNKSRIMALQLGKSDIKIVDTQKMLQVLKQMIDSNRLFKIDTQIVTSLRFEVTDSDMLDYKTAYRKELAIRDITIPFELAIVDTTGRLYAATGDTLTFRQTPVKSSISELSGADGKAGLQAAFPNANMFLLRKMLWILIVTVLLIVIGAFLLGYLLRHFFRQKKIADLRIDFMNNMTHELKTPISSVSVALQLVQDERRFITEEKRKSYLAIAQRELLRLNVLVENVLKILTLERTGLEMKRDEIAVLPWLSGIMERMAPLLDKSETELNLSVIPETLEMAADRTHITNVIHNIVENALKYNDKKVPRINISAWNDGRQTNIKVSDNGEGIPAKYLERVFDKFFRVPQGDRHDTKGYGLGLSYVKGIVEKHKGTITVNSVVKEGSEFIISLPV